MAIVTDPVYPVVDEEVTLSISPATGTSTATRFELTSVPDLSDLEVGVILDEAGAPAQAFTPDVAGEYGIRAFDVLARVGLPLYAGDPNGGALETILATETSTIYVGDVLELRIETISGHDTTLQIQINNNTVRSASLVDPATELARAAALDPTVAAAVAALEGMAVTSLASSITTRVAALGEVMNDHFADATVHATTADTVNGITRGEPFSDESALSTLQLIYDALMGHLVAVDPVSDWHVADDTKNLPVTARPRDKATATVTLSDLEERVYERHRAQLSSPIVHEVADGANALPAPTTLTSAIVAYLDFIASNAPAGPAGENEGAVDAEGLFGMRRA